jgi:hypothetical protein
MGVCNGFIWLELEVVAAIVDTEKSLEFHDRRRISLAAELLSAS